MSHILKALFFMLVTSTVCAKTTTFGRDNLKEIDFASVKEGQRQLQASSNCLDDTERLDENIRLQHSFNNVLQTFSKSFNETTALKYCDASKNGRAVSLHCLVDYSSYEATKTYNTQCQSLRGNNYNVSLLMFCTSNNSNTLEMDLKNIPTCMGRSCGTGEIYLGLMDVLGGVQDSIGTGSEGSWECRYYHDFEALISAPSTVIEIPAGKKEESRAYRYHLASHSTLLSLTATLMYFFM